MTDTTTDYPYVLIAVHAFTTPKGKGPYVRGDVIEDPVIIAEIMNTHLESFVVKRAK